MQNRSKKPFEPTQVTEVVFRVEEKGKVYYVIEEKTSEGIRFNCTCPTKYNCKHIMTVKEYIIDYKKYQPSFKIENFSKAKLSTGSSTSKETKTPIPIKAIKEIDLTSNTETLDAIINLTQEVVSDVLSGTIEKSREKLKSRIEQLTSILSNVCATDLLKSIADLRRSILAERIEPDTICNALERTEGALRILKKFRKAEEIDERLKTTYLGKTTEFFEAEKKEDFFLIELARSSVRTPFNKRRTESYYMEQSTGQLFVEEQYQRPGVSNLKIGPFPRILHVNLAIVIPRPQPQGIKLLQYSIHTPPKETHFLRVRNMAIRTLATARQTYKKTVNLVKTPYPVFVAFAPASTELKDKAPLIMHDGEGESIGLAYTSSRYTCASMENICADAKLHVVCGFILREGPSLAINPISCIVEKPDGFHLIRLG